MRHLISPFCAAAIVLLCVACSADPTHNATARRATGPAVDLRGQRIGVEVAADDGSRARGLMFRKAMPADQGMLFVFPDEAPRSFWMKNTLIPLDMLFFDSRRKLVTLLAAVPPCKADPCQAYPSTAPARYVLELNAGTAATLGIRTGDAMTLEGVSTQAQ